MKYLLLPRTFLLMAAFIMLSPVSAALAAEGGLRLAQTRIIFNADNKNAGAVIKNNGQQVYLIKAAVMNTPEGNNPALPAAPFMVTPPMFRLEKESQSTALIVRNGTTQLPADRESVFWLSFLAIPSVSKNGETPDNMTSAQVSVGIRNVIKLFYRPAGLSPSFEQAQEKLTFRREGRSVSVNNPTPYYLTLGALSFNGRDVSLQDNNPMIAPFSSAIFPAEGAVSQVQWAVITDYGDMGQIHTAAVSSGE
ncbi:fimbrial biogenesis chaperone [Morganella morganii]|uniref:fimbrial biogenesis chaperone n=1 Tax=Morganella morganii TaxID=582 RepID=UPI000469F097|nr:molecular chaperone [Morganella morganii]